MAENIKLQKPNFSLTPQAGAIASIDNDGPETILRVKSTSGGFIKDYILSANMNPDNEVIALEYCGPKNLNGFVDGVTFFTVERVLDFTDETPWYDAFGNPHRSSKQCIIKRWEVNVGFSLLNLKNEKVLNTSGDFYYDVNAAAVEYYNRSFDLGQSDGQTYLTMNNVSNVENGDILFLGPSTDTDNPGATENVVVSYVDNYDDKVYLNSPNLYQYRNGDPISFFKNVYLFSRFGLAGDDRYGTIFKHHAYSGDRKQYLSEGVYSRISGARWNTEVNAIASICVGQLLFIRPYNYYLNYRSMFLSNVDRRGIEPFEVYDIIFDNYNVYKLMKKATTKNDVGDKYTEAWDDYNYQQDTLLPYTHNVSIYTEQQKIIGPDRITIYLRTKDQYGVGLRDVNINLYDDGSDLGAVFDPLNAQAITDKDGYASIDYINGQLYHGPTLIQVRSDKSSSFTGSEYCWNVILVDTDVEYDSGFGRGSMFQKEWIFGHMRNKLIWTPFKITRGNRYNEDLIETTVPPYYLICYSKFGSPGGNWEEGSSHADTEANKCWPWFPVSGDGPLDELNMGCDWDCITWERTKDDPPNIPYCNPSVLQKVPRPNFIAQVLEFTQKGVPNDFYLNPNQNILNEHYKGLRVKQPTWFWQYIHNTDCTGVCLLEEGEPVPNSLFQLDSVHDLQFSQLRMSKHNHWVDGFYTPDLETYVNLDQFIFVRDAVPSFFSEKNPRETDIWIRMRPAFTSLDGSTLRFFVREVYTIDDIHYDTGYYDVIQRYGWPPNNSRVQLDYFLAGGDPLNPVLGIEFRYDNPDIYHHNALVFVHIEIYDTAAEPNFIYTDYWFRIIPDYKSPYLLNEDPYREEDQVPVDTKIYFEVKDDGEGVDIDTLEVYLNSRLIYHYGMADNPETVIEKVSINHYKVTLTLPYTLQFGKDYSVGVQVTDISDNRNRLRDSYRFYTAHSEAPWFTGFDPKKCLKGMPRFRDISFIVLGAGDGVDGQTIRIQVHDRDVTRDSKISPIIYRIS